MIREIIEIQRKEQKIDFSSPAFETFYIIIATLQAISITQQGFFYAIVYGWTREDFLHIMTISTHARGSLSPLVNGLRSWGQRETDSGELEVTSPLPPEEEGEHAEGKHGKGENEQRYETSKSQSLFTPNLSHRLPVSFNTRQHSNVA